MAKGKRRPLKRASRKHAPPPRSDEVAEFDDSFQHIQERVKLLRQRFCQEYVKDFNGANALRRMGYNWQRPEIRASEWMKEAYTQWYLAQLTDKLEEKAIVTKNMVLLGLLREANSTAIDASASSRVGALRSLAKCLGIEVTKVEGNVTVNGGVMAVPVAASLEEWEAATKKAQAALKTEVRK